MNEVNIANIIRYSLESTYRKYVQGQGFMSFAKNRSNKYGKKIIR